jgi:ABC-2 type transport system permease protein
MKFAAREYKTAVKTKGFIIGLILAPVLMGGSLIAFLLLKDNVDTTDKYIALIDRSGAVAGAVIEAAEIRNEKEIFDEESGEKIRPAYHFNIVEPNLSDPQAQRLEQSDRVRNGELYAFMEIGKDVVHPVERTEDNRILYYAKNAAMDDLRRWVNWPINNHLRKLRMADAGMKEEDYQDLFYWVGIEGLGLVKVDEQTGTIEDARRASEIEAILVPIVLMMLMFLMIMMSVPGMLNSVMEEKTQRIAEVLLGSIKPFEFMMGKVIGGIAVSLTSSLVYFTLGIFLLNYMELNEFIPYHVLPWFITYMILAIIMFGAFAAALGATCSEPKDAQSLTFPMILPLLIPMFIYFPVAKEPLSNLATYTSLVPLFTPTLMILRQTTPSEIPGWQPIAGLIGVLLFTLLFVWLGSRIFRMAILIQGTPPKFSNILKWAIKG